MNAQDAILALLRSEEAKFDKGSDDPKIGVERRERCRAKASVLRTEIAYIERGDHLTAVERTPETVLRAMSAAYLQAAEASNVAYYRAPRYDESLCGPATEAEMDAETVRGMLYSLLAGREPTEGVSTYIVLDYQQRLSGARPLNAPPLED